MKDYQDLRQDLYSIKNSINELDNMIDELKRDMRDIIVVDRTIYDSDEYDNLSDTNDSINYNINNAINKTYR